VRFYWSTAVVVDFGGRYRALERDRRGNDRYGRFVIRVSSHRFRQSACQIRARNRSQLLSNFDAIMSLHNGNLRNSFRLYALNSNSSLLLLLSSKV
jgi:hypothetical protein